MQTVSFLAKKIVLFDTSSHMVRYVPHVGLSGAVADDDCLACYDMEEVEPVYGQWGDSSPCPSMEDDRRSREILEADR